MAARGEFLCCCSTSVRRDQLPRKSDSNLIFAASVLVSGQEQLLLLPEPRVSMPK
jgi:hypothetical protein